jgi:hypothetical protein
VDPKNLSFKFYNLKVFAHWGFNGKVLPGPLTKAPGLYYEPGV